MVEAGRGGPTPRGVADLAIIAGLQVADVLARRDRTVMATEAIGRHSPMIKGRPLPSPRAMAVAALSRTLDMVDGLLRRHPSDMT